ncbi:MAG TPA: 23S rRNA (adenine(2503)-C(2))-methyltransferase RlmN [Clostridia bacterium]|nr:23S rRNA (adenine(2503)-C(2))-methyltransferase RlmN [Clostridia bacterium]
MKLLLDYDLNTLEKELAPFGQPKYVAKQIFGWINKGRDFDEMTNVSKDFRERLKQDFYAVGVTVEKKLTSKDGTVKYLFRLNDNNFIESVLMSYKYGRTLCVSTQVGCRMGCTFCASGIGGLVRNLTAGEILSQIVAVNRDFDDEKRAVTNVVLMGSGEPLDNYDNVIAFLRLVNSADGLNISYRNISLSTSGIVPNMYKLADENMPINLTVSLHSATQQKREEIMPIARKYSIDDIIAAAKNYFEKTGRRVIFEYTLIDGVNDSFVDAEKLSKLVRGMSAHINLIRLNPVTESAHKPASSKNAYAFAEKLTSLGASATVRRQMGVDIDGACGQLRQRHISDIDKAVEEINHTENIDNNNHKAKKIH